MTLVDIARNWQSFQALSQVEQQLVLGRLDTCDVCPHKRQQTSTGEYLKAHHENRVDSVYYCSMCGCPLLGKTKNPENGCPANRWMPKKEDESYYN